MSAPLSAGGEREPLRAVSVQATFHVRDDRQAQAVAAKMVDRANEIANLPECECDLDVSIERARPAAATSTGLPGVAASPGL